jgi:uncharacterized protein YlxP (DUF503 family)
MHIGLLILEIHLPASSSLKDKRQALQSLQRRLRNRFNLSIAEVDHQELWQRATLAVVSVSGRREILDRLFDKIVSETERTVPGEVIRADREFLG